VPSPQPSQFAEELTQLNGAGQSIRNHFKTDLLSMGENNPLYEYLNILFLIESGILIFKTYG
jgi:hypothetical protein